MNLPTKISVAALIAIAVATATPPALAAKTSSKDARVTQIIHDVKLLPSEADPKPAEINDHVDPGTGVRTGDQSRSELTFSDLTITRLGANSIFSFNKAGRSVDLGGGSVLLRVPKDSGGASIKAPAVSVAVTGTTLILEAARAGRSRLIVLEGTARLRLVKNSSQTRNVAAGQMLTVPAGATTLPEPENIDLNQVMKTHPLIVGFPPLPSQKLITEAANNPRGPDPNEPIYQGQPVGGGGGPIITGGFGLPGLGLPTGGYGGGGRGGRGPTKGDVKGQSDGQTKGQTAGTTGGRTSGQPTTTGGQTKGTKRPKSPNNPNGTIY